MKIGRIVIMTALLFSSPLKGLQQCSTDLLYLFRALDARSFLSSMEACNQDSADDRKDWFFQVIPSYSKETNAFNGDGCSLDLASYIFAPTVEVQDIYCPSRLAQEGILEGGCDIQFNYIKTLAETQLNFCAEQTTLQYDIGVFKSWCIYDFLDVSIGLNIPVRYRSRTLDLHLTHGALGRLVQSEGQFTPFINNISEFFSEFISAEDFVLTHILEKCKNLTFKECQNRFGVGDIGVSLFGNIEGEWCNQYFSSMSFGLNITAPSSNDCNSEEILWELSLGNRGATIVQPFFYTDFQYNEWFNPSLFLAACIVPSYADVRRQPQVIKGTTEDFIDVLCFPENFNAGVVTQDFQCCDSLIPLFANKALNVCVDLDSGVVARVGNQAIIGCIALGLFYTFDYKSGETVSIDSSNDGNDLELCDSLCGDDKTAHFVEWHMGSAGCSDTEWSVGSRHVVAGNDVFKTNQFFFQFVARY